jgi:putative transposase
LGVLIHKAFRYRVYPTDAQVKRATEWEGALRFLWNIAHEQRLMGLSRPRGERRYPTAFDQINELTALRAELPWLADVPRDVCSQLLVELDKAWQRCFKRTARAPRWKKRGGNSIGLTEPHPKVWRLDGTAVRFPKLGNIRAVIHRPLEGTPKTCTLKRDGDQWFVSILCVIERPDPPQRVDPVVALDRGITNLLADSDGRIVPNPKHLEKALVRLARAQRVVARRKKGSQNRARAALRVASIHRKVRRQREHLLHQLSHDYAKSHGTVVVEDLNVQGMIRNHHLSRHIAGASWGRFGEMLHYKLEWSGGSLVEVHAAYSSQTCSRCGHVDAASRQSERFCCTSCGHVEHADVNAAKVLKSRANRSVLPVEGTALEAALRSRKLKVKLRVPRRFASESRPL